jgi:hypothetical protein
MACSLRVVKNAELQFLSYWVMESLIKIKSKIKTKRGWYLQWWDTDHGLKKTFIEKMPIDRATQNLKILQVLQFISVV